MKKFGLLMVSLLLAFNINAATHYVMFGGDNGYNYSPNTLQVNVGDTIVWIGDFSFHPLVSTMVPDGATQFAMSAGNVLTYYVEVPGQYLYQCQAHFDQGMTGS